jgi:hypothetical protein
MFPVFDGRGVMDIIKIVETGCRNATACAAYCNLATFLALISLILISLPY